MTYGIVGTQIYEAQGNADLYQGIDGADQDVRHVQFVGHNLIGMLAMGIAKVLMQHDAVEDGQYSVNAIDTEEYEVCRVLGLDDDAAEEEQEDVTYAYRTYVTCKAPGPTLLSEVEEAEHKY